tara:strand:+ start:1935 stop:2540 length:606 start_codon:yes stop_codon:yes gene_type:complete
MALLFAKNNSLSAVTQLPASVSGGGLNLISTQTASDSASISFTSGLDSTYKEYIFRFYDIHPATDSQDFQFQGNASGGSGYNETMTTTHFLAQHAEDDSYSSLEYSGSRDLAQSTSFATLSGGVGNDNDQSLSGFLHLFNPSSTTFIKHFMSNVQISQSSNYSVNSYSAGYFNTTSAIDEIQFKFASGNIDAGTIKLYGVT